MAAAPEISAKTIRPHWRALIALLRPHQWAKNLLLFLPLLTAHKLGERALALEALLGFIAFCLVASAIYVINDMLDIAEDRRHPRKCGRPFASNELPLATGYWLAPLLGIAAAGIALLLPRWFAACLTVYLGVTTLYSVWLKHIAMLDVLILASLYTLRLIAGAAAIGVPASYWLLAFSMFVFTSLALLKRHTELIQMRRRDNAGDVRVRGYRIDDTALLAAFGACSGLLAVMVLALYIDAPEIASQYHRIHALWLLCPLLMYWIGRAWLLSHRGSMHDDPVVYALTDKVSLALATLMLCLLLVAL